MVRPSTNTSTPATNGGAGPRRSAWPPATTMPTSRPSWKALVTHLYRPMPWRSSLIVGRIVMTARASKATRVMVRTRPMVSPRRAGVISPAGRLDDRFMVGPCGHATGARPAPMAGLTGNRRVWKGTPVVGQPPNPPIGPTAPQVARAASRPCARCVGDALARFSEGSPACATTRHHAAPGHGLRHAQATSPWRGKLKMAFLIAFPPAAGLGTAAGQRQAGRRTVVRSGPDRRLRRRPTPSGWPRWSTASGPGAACPP